MKKFLSISVLSAVLLLAACSPQKETPSTTVPIDDQTTQTPQTSQTPQTPQTPSTTPTEPQTTPQGKLQSTTINIKDFAFSPATVTINQGSSVTWLNNDEVSHPVAAINGTFKSADLGKGQTFSFIFATAGTYEYYCTTHPSMTGTIIVQ